jgi:N-acyl-D-amino-acid deacylase
MNPTELHPTNNFIIKNAKIYNGFGGQPFLGSVAIQDQHLTAVGNITLPEDDRAFKIIDANGLAVAPGFINMLSWACESLLADGRSQSDLRQGVTLEVMGEGFSYGPLNDAMRAHLISQQADFHFDIPWNTLDEYLEHLVQKGVSCNVASFIGTDTLRTYTIGYENRPASPQELQTMCAMARQAMQEGAVGVSSALAYVPDSFHSTEELIALASVAAEFDGLYIAHMRGEGNRLLQGIDEMITIAEQSGARVEIYHLKVAGWQNWGKIDAAIDKIDSARARGLSITANIYPYHAAASGLDLTMPAWVQEGGLQSWIERLKNPALRQRLIEEMNTPSDEWENALLEVQDLDGILFTNFQNPKLKHLVGKTLGEVSTQRNSSPAETIIDLIIEDSSRVGVVYFTSLEDNLRRLIQLPYVSVCSDARSMAPEGVFLKSSTHPRAYGSFARFLGKYIRDEKLLSLEEAIRRLTHLPASNLRLKNRGILQPGAYADLVIFDPEKIQDHATFTNPQQYATGIHHVFVNGKPVIFNSAHTGAMPGQVIRP